MLKENLSKIICTVLILAIVAALSGFAIGAERLLPENPISETMEELLKPEIIYGVNGANELPNQGGKRSESENENGDPEQSDEKDKDTKHTDEGTPETEKEDDSGENKPLFEYVTEGSGGEAGSIEPGGETAGADGKGDIGGNELAPEGDPIVVTDLDNKIVTSSEISGDIFSFYAYIENGNESHSIVLNFRNSKTSFSGEILTPDSGDYYSAKLALGANYITIYLKEGGETLSNIQYIVTYQAEKAGNGKNEVGDNPPSISTNLDGFSGTLENRFFTFVVTARTGDGNVIYSDHIEVTLDGVTVTNPTGSTSFEYVLNFGPENEHVVTVLAWDDDGNSTYKDYTVNFRSVADGESIGTATIVVDATTAGYGIIGSTECEILQGETAAETLVKALAEMGLSVSYSGTEKIGFYVRAIGGINSVGEVPPELWELVLRDGITVTSPSNGDSLGERDYTAGSGWMYSINGALYPGKGMSEYNLSDGDVLYLRFTIAYGKDIGGSGAGGNGALESYCGIWTDGGYIELEHEYAEIERREPTASEDGYVIYECSLCKKTYTEILPATGGEHEHEYYETGRAEPTEDADGYIEYTCDCGDVYFEPLYYEGGEGGDE